MESTDGYAIEEDLSLADRLPDYAATFAIGFVVSSLVGVVLWIVSDIPLSSTIGYTVILYGVVFLLAGGSTGGGYTNLGMAAMGSLTRTGKSDDLQKAQESKFAVAPQERLQRGLRPESNSRAFWQVIGGVLYIVIGLVIVGAFG